MAEPNTMLIADDNDDDVLFLLQGFTDIGVVVNSTRARDGNSAIELLIERQFSLVVLDYYLPKKSGIEVMRALQARGHVPDVAIVSSYISPEQHGELLECGVRRILAKPTDLVGFALLASNLVSLIRK